MSGREDRSPTHPGIITPEWAAAQAEVAIRAADENRRWARALDQKMGAIEGRLIEVCGLDGKGGAIYWLKTSIDDAKHDLAAKQTESARSQGERLQVLERLASDLQLKQVDMSARYGAVAATILSLFAFVLAAWRAMK